jgi:hypothetical protein
MSANVQTVYRLSGAYGLHFTQVCACYSGLTYFISCDQVTDALPDLAGLALPPAFAGDVCTIMGDGAQRSSAGTAIGILVAPILAV